MLTKLQKATLCQLAAKAFTLQDSLGLVDAAPTLSRSAQLTEWRRQETKNACGLDSLSKCSNKHYLPIRAHFQVLCGDDAAAFESHLKHGAATGHGDPKDTPQSRADIRHLIISALTAHARIAADCPTIEANGGAISAYYIEEIARAQFKTKNLSSLTTAQLTKLLYTTRNRIAAREGRGTTKTRNKSQRAKKTA